VSVQEQAPASWVPDVLTDSVMGGVLTGRSDRLSRRLVWVVLVVLFAGGWGQGLLTAVQFLAGHDPRDPHPSVSRVWSQGVEGFSQAALLVVAVVLAVRWAGVPLSAVGLRLPRTRGDWLDEVTGAGWGGTAHRGQLCPGHHLLPVDPRAERRDSRRADGLAGRAERGDGVHRRGRGAASPRPVQLDVGGTGQRSGPSRLPHLLRPDIGVPSRVGRRCCAALPGHRPSPWHHRRPRLVGPVCRPSRLALVVVPGGVLHPCCRPVLGRRCRDHAAKSAGEWSCFPPIHTEQRPCSR